MFDNLEGAINNSFLKNEISQSQLIDFLLLIFEILKIRNTKYNIEPTNSENDINSLMIKLIELGNSPLNRYKILNGLTQLEIVKSEMEKDNITFNFSNLRDCVNSLEVPQNRQALLDLFELIETTF
jgi:hypothetical protein